MTPHDATSQGTALRQVLQVGHLSRGVQVQIGQLPLLRSKSAQFGRLQAKRSIRGRRGGQSLPSSLLHGLNTSSVTTRADYWWISLLLAKTRTLCSVLGSWDFTGKYILCILMCIYNSTWINHNRTLSKRTMHSLDGLAPLTHLLTGNCSNMSQQSVNVQ